MDKQSNILVIAPHHDDEVLGCGGSIASAAKAGNVIDVVYMTAGYLGVPQEKNKIKAIEIREEEAREAGKILGVRQQLFLRHPDREVIYSLEQVQELIQIIRMNQYSIVCFPHNEEKDREHRMVYEIAKEAVWMSNSKYFPILGKPSQVQNIYLYEIWTPLINYHIKIDISDYIELKQKAAKAYKTQFSNQQIEGVIGLNKYRAALSNDSISACEVFSLLSEKV